MTISETGNLARQETSITKTQKNELKKLSKDTGIAITEHIRRAIDIYLKNNKGQHGRDTRHN